MRNPAAALGQPCPKGTATRNGRIWSAQAQQHAAENFEPVAGPYRWCDVRRGHAADCGSSVVDLATAGAWAATANAGGAPFAVLEAVDPDGRRWNGGNDLHHAFFSARAAHGQAVFTTTSADRRHLVLLVASPDGEEAVDAEAAAERLRSDLAATGRRALVASAVAAGPDDLRMALDEVRTVLWVVLSVHYPPGIYQLDDVLIEAAVLRSPDIAARLAQRVAPLASSGAPLLETLRSFLTNGHDRRRTARRMHIHPNTLVYRLRRIHELTGLSPTRPVDIQTLGAALAAWQVVGYNPDDLGRTTRDNQPVR